LQKMFTVDMLSFVIFLTGILNVDATTAVKRMPVKMEHVVSPVTLERFVKFMEFVEELSEGWLRLVSYILMNIKNMAVMKTSA